MKNLLDLYFLSFFNTQGSCCRKRSTQPIAAINISEYPGERKYKSSKFFIAHRAGVLMLLGYQFCIDTHLGN
jgi:hypothetical protein